MKEIKGIVIHHSASKDVSANTINEWHLERGWNQVGYHFVIRQNGDIEPARQWDRAGAHARGRNRTHIGICLTGHFGKYPPSIEQINSLIKLVNGLINRFDIESIEKHHENCPNEYFPWKFFTENLSEEVIK